nr:reverse transcriptase domain-containing protein [Tanacetum cinerariifolium]
MTHAAIRKLVADSVATVLEAQTATMASTNNPNRNSGPRKTPIARKCTYERFMSCKPFYFNSTEGAVGLIRWFKWTESVMKHNSVQETNNHKRKLEDRRNTTNGNNNNYRNNNPSNDHHQQQNKRQETFRTYTANKSTRSCMMQSASLTKRNVSMVPFVGSISPEGFLPLILLLVVIIARVVVTVVVVVAIGGVPSILKLSFMVIGFLYRIVFHYLLY